MLKYQLGDKLLDKTSLTKCRSFKCRIRQERKNVSYKSSKRSQQMSGRDSNFSQVYKFLEGIPISVDCYSNLFEANHRSVICYKSFVVDLEHSLCLVVDSGARMASYWLIRAIFGIKYRIFPCIRDPFCPFYFALEIRGLLYMGVLVCTVLQKRLSKISKTVGGLSNQGSLIQGK